MREKTRKEKVTGNKSKRKSNRPATTRADIHYMHSQTDRDERKMIINEHLVSSQPTPFLLHTEGRVIQFKRYHHYNKQEKDSCMKNRDNN